ncbi:hypothetical protein PanWU01x14_066070 [Parasponia andersonii]|uniref:Uncharacterized protein n=1 Tax=Parasponia andersonii TaxID=3476 RepID=A0A2P5DG10_PARAD|nr:hypothetical protein PanWU01x14_066070 [Parasponia andersonii]
MVKDAETALSPSRHPLLNLSRPSSSAQCS